MSNTITFVREALSNYWSVGSPVPSSPFLAKAMVEALGEVPPDRPLVELGPGTGVFTGLLLETYPNNPVYGIEWNSRFASLLREKYPRFRVFEGCASKMCEFLQEEGINPGEVGGIISGLPLTSFKKDLRQSIFGAVNKALAPDALYIQFTYHRWAWNLWIHPQGLKRDLTRRVWRNVPPALVLTFSKNGI